MHEILLQKTKKYLEESPKCLIESDSVRITSGAGGASGDPLRISLTQGRPNGLRPAFGVASFVSYVRLGEQVRHAPV